MPRLLQFAVSKGEEGCLSGLTSSNLATGKLTTINFTFPDFRLRGRRFDRETVSDCRFEETIVSLESSKDFEIRILSIGIQVARTRPYGSDIFQMCLCAPAHGSKGREEAGAARATNYRTRATSEARSNALIVISNGNNAKGPTRYAIGDR